MYGYKIIANVTVKDSFYLLSSSIHSTMSVCVCVRSTRVWIHMYKHMWRMESSVITQYLPSFLRQGLSLTWNFPKLAILADGEASRDLPLSLSPNLALTGITSVPLYLNFCGGPGVRTQVFVVTRQVTYLLSHLPSLNLEFQILIVALFVMGTI